MKLTQKQLRSLITETVKKSKNCLVEIDDSVGSDDYSSFVESLVAEFEAINIDRYVDEDPSMSALGPEAWHDQVVSAGVELETLIRDAISTVEDKLTNGEYHRG